MREKLFGQCSLQGRFCLLPLDTLNIELSTHEVKIKCCLFFTYKIYDDLTYK
jgi:hypothetical protein